MAKKDDGRVKIKVREDVAERCTDNAVRGDLQVLAARTSILATPDGDFFHLDEAERVGIIDKLPKRCVVLV